jgi:hypothetical protein
VKLPQHGSREWAQLEARLKRDHAKHDPEQVWLLDGAPYIGQVCRKAERSPSSTATVLGVRVREHRGVKLQGTTQRTADNRLPIIYGERARMDDIWGCPALQDYVVGLEVRQHPFSGRRGCILCVQASMDAAEKEWIAASQWLINKASGGKDAGFSRRQRVCKRPQCTPAPDAVQREQKRWRLPLLDNLMDQADKLEVSPP